MRFVKALAAITLMASALPASAATDNQGFTAHYRLSASGYPDAEVSHRLSNQAGRVESKMSGRTLALATGNERSHFLDIDKQLTPLLYASDVGMLGYKKRYQLSPEDLGDTLDRQMMFYQLSRDARAGHCVKETPCRLSYAGHRGSERKIRYYQVEHPTLDNPLAPNPVTLKVFEQGRKAPLLMSFHPEHPGLIVEAEMRRKDGREYRLILGKVEVD